MPIVHKNIYDMKLHETGVMIGGETVVQRVAGGWIYGQRSVESEKHFATEGAGVFVPYSDEFKKRNILDDVEVYDF